MAPMISMAPGFLTLDSISINGIPVTIPATPGSSSHNTGTKPVIIATRLSAKYIAEKIPMVMRSLPESFLVFTISSILLISFLCLQSLCTFQVHLPVHCGFPSELSVHHPPQVSDSPALWLQACGLS